MKVRNQQYTVTCKKCDRRWFAGGARRPKWEGEAISWCRLCRRYTPQDWRLRRPA